MPQPDVLATLEALLFVSGEPVKLEALEKAFDMTPLQLQAAIDALAQQYDDAQRGLMLRRIEDSVQLVTKPQCAELIAQMNATTKKVSLSQSVLETLSVIAYQQPVTRAEIEQVRGVRCEYALSTLEKYGLIEEVGRKDTLGRPVLFGTTTAFLTFFGLESLDQLPDLMTFTVEPEEMPQ